MRKSIFVRVLLLAVVAAAFATPSHAQSPLAINFDEAFSPDLYATDLPVIRQALNLDAEQASIVQSLLHDYTEQFNSALLGVREDLRAADAILGTEDPDIDRQREELRGVIASALEQMQQDLQNLPAGASAAEFKEKYDRQIKSLQQRLEQLKPQPVKPEQLAKLFDDASLRLEKWRGVKRQMRDKFTDNVQTILHEEQKAHWPPLEWQLRRERTLGRGLLQGESADLTEVVGEMKLAPAQALAVAGAMADYQASLDAALRSRNELMDSSERGLFKAVEAGDRAALSAIIERITQARVAVRAANDTGAASIAAALGDAGSRFTDAWLQRGYPLVFRDTQILRLIKAAREIQTLTPPQTEGLGNMETAYEAELAPLNQQVLAAVRQFEPAQVTQREVRRMLPSSTNEESTPSGRAPDGMQAAFVRRVEAGRKYDSQLQALLGPDLYERLPRNDRLVTPPATAATPGNEGE